MPTVDISQADLIREFIEKKIDEKYDFSKASYKKKAIKEFVELHPQLQTNTTKVGKHFGEILKEVSRKKNIPPEQIGIKKPKVNPAMIGQNSDMNATIEARPQSEVLVGAPVQQQQSSQIIPGQQPGQPGFPGGINPTNKGNHDEKAVAAAITAFYLVLRTGFASEAELLSDDEKESLGKLGKPVFDRFFGENEDLVICFLGIGGVLVPKLAKGRKLKKEKQAKEKKELEANSDAA